MFRRIRSQRDKAIHFASCQGILVTDDATYSEDHGRLKIVWFDKTSAHIFTYLGDRDYTYKVRKFGANAWEIKSHFFASGIRIG